MSKTYQPAEVEFKAQKYWEDNHSFSVTEDPNREKYYCLSMLPYPSGKLHMGHVRNYTIGDVISRYQRMLGKNVLQPMGWDAFGLPAENAAIQHKMPPAKWTYQNIAYMKNQLKRLGFAYDWNREFATCTPEYYRWEQWFFTRLVKKGLAYKKMAIVNWDPVENTVLANEQVENGRGWRSGAIVERRKISQWFIRITAYAEELLNELDTLNGWPKSVKTMQKNWIGRSEGVSLNFPVLHEKKLTVFTTRPDTIMGVTCIFLATEHPFLLKVASKNRKIQQFIEKWNKQKTSELELETMEKNGLPLGIHAIHPISGTKVPIWVTNFILMEYGTGAVMSVPAHDQRDWQFAKKYHIVIKPVIQLSQGEHHNYNQSPLISKDGILCNSGQFNGLLSSEACGVIRDYLEEKGIGTRTVHYRLRDWGVSRQRYWGCPIPIIYDKKNNIIPVPDNQLPVILPEDVTFLGVQSPIKKDPNFYQTTIPHTDQPATRETDTFDTFFESSWYFVRYCCPDSNDKMLDDRANYWLPVDQYVGGIEHAVLHLFYARFFYKLMRDAGLINSDEPFINLLTQGMALKNGEKMSKSKGNTVDPQSMIDRYGADTVRLFIMFAAPPEQVLEWNDDALAGTHRFLNRWWLLVQNNKECIAQAKLTLDKENWSDRIDDPEAKKLRRFTHRILERSNRNYKKFHYNTVIAGAMELLNVLYKFDSNQNFQCSVVYRETLIILNKLLYPIVPHISHALWHELGEVGDIMNSKWPISDPEALITDRMTLMIQVNGKLRSQIELLVNTEEDAIRKCALSDQKIQKFIKGKIVKQVVIIPMRLVNIVV